MRTVVTLLLLVVAALAEPIQVHEEPDEKPVEKRGLSGDEQNAVGDVGFAGTAGGEGLGKTVEKLRPYAVPVVKVVRVPVAAPVPVAVPHAVLVPVPQPVPVHIRVPLPVEVPVLRQVHVPVEKHYPVEVERKPFPVHVPVYKHIYHIPKHHEPVLHHAPHHHH
ncbi:uncharacterized protein LOC124775837 [Schistocerca piceifrons]|uniref:uncharacterized protein LOC124775837 n=1 Tax=Schistocerca piceifrons TaxID=274613 RepID=UPI001F5F007C|nr:uncharacterized protein LOC124775837 [Schistocerca piceifrons]